MRLKCLLLVFFMCVGAPAVGQSHKLDSLKALLPGKSDKEMSDLYMGLCYGHFDIDHTLALFYGHKLLLLSLKMEDTLRIVKAIRLKAHAHRRLENMDSSNILNVGILPLARKLPDSKELLYLSMALGVGFMWTAEYDRALEYNFEALRLAKRFNSNEDLGPILNNIGLIYYKLNNYRRALSYYRSFCCARPRRDTSSIISSYLNSSLCYSHLRIFDSARHFLREARVLAKSIQSDLHYNYDIGFYHEMQRQHDSATFYYEKVLAQAKAQRNEHFQLLASRSLYGVKNDQGRSDEAIAYLRRVEGLLPNTSFNSEAMFIYKRMSQWHKRAGDFKRYAMYQEKYSIIRDSLLDFRFMNKFSHIEKDFLEREKAEEIAIQNEALVRNQVLIERQNIFNLFIGIIAILISIVAVLLYSRHKQSKLLNARLDSKVYERTLELHKLNLKLKQTLDQEGIVSAKRSRKIRLLIGKANALSRMGMNDIDKEKYLREILLVIEEMSCAV
jgi:tetratricopeptide (TPR) repeat protein